MFARSIEAAIGWMSEHLRGDASGLDEVLGPPALRDPEVSRLQSQVRAPRLWARSDAILGSQLDMRLVGEPGLAVLLVAEGPGYSSTPMGSLLLDRNTLDWLLTIVNGAGAHNIGLRIPSDPNLLGVSAWFQAITFTDGNGARLSNAVSVTGAR